MGNTLFVLLPATHVELVISVDPSVTTPELQPPLPSLAQRHCPVYLPYGHHRTLNLACHLSACSIL